MYDELYQYLVQYKTLHLPGIGSFVLERKPASADFSNKQILAPRQSISLLHGNTTPARSFFAWLGKALGLDEREALIRFNDFVFDLKKKIKEGTRVTWNGIGTLSPGLAGEIRFETAVRDQPAGPAVKAEKIIRENASHTVRVGEDEKTSEQMIEYLNQQPARKSYWWAWAAAVALVLVMFIGWYFSEHGVSVSATGNNAAVQTIPSPVYYKNP